VEGNFPLPNSWRLEGCVITISTKKDSEEKKASRRDRTKKALSPKEEWNCEENGNFPTSEKSTK